MQLKEKNKKLKQETEQRTFIEIKIITLIIHFQVLSIELVTAVPTL